MKYCRVAENCFHQQVESRTQTIGTIGPRIWILDGILVMYARTEMHLEPELHPPLRLTFRFSIQFCCVEDPCKLRNKCRGRSILLS